jgi:hypothetical protein
MDPRRLLGLALFGFLTFAIGWDLFHEWNRPIARPLAPLFLLLLSCFLRFAFFRPVPRTNRIDSK